MTGSSGASKTNKASRNANGGKRSETVKTADLAGDPAGGPHNAKGHRA